MSIPNENENPKQASDYIAINENGELVVTDPKLAESLQELSPEELEQIAGGGNPGCSNGSCPSRQ
ncbi:MAG: type A2 lanthipeptide [Nostoc sp.]